MGGGGAPSEPVFLKNIQPGKISELNICIINKLEDDMGSYTTIKNSLKKMENKLGEGKKSQHCGVILKADFEKLVFPEEGIGERRKVGYLVIPGKLTVEEWELKHAIA